MNRRNIFFLILFLIVIKDRERHILRPDNLLCAPMNCNDLSWRPDYIIVD